MFERTKAVIHLIKNFDKIVKKNFTWFDDGRSQDIVTLDQFTQNLLFSNQYRVLAKEGYMENAIAYHCIDKITSCAKNIPVKILIDGEEKENNSLSKELRRNLLMPNVDENGSEFLVKTLSYLMIKGEYYIHTDLGMRSILGTESFRPDRVSKTQSGDERIHSFLYTRGSKTETFTRDEDGFFDLLYFKTFNPLSDIDGLSPLSAGGMSIDQYNEANKWNKNLFENGTQLSGILNLGSVDKGGIPGTNNISAEQIQELSQRVNKLLSDRKGGTAVINAPGTYTPVDMSPQDMDFIIAQKAKALEICNCLNYPPYLLGIEGATFNNQKEAKESLYEDSVIPTAQDFYTCYGSYHSRLYDTQIEYKLDLDSISALAEKRERKKDSARKDFSGGIISKAEAREAGGREAEPGDEDIFMMPRTSGENGA